MTDRHLKKGERSTTLKLVLPTDSLFVDGYSEMSCMSSSSDPVADLLDWLPDEVDRGTDREHSGDRISLDKAVRESESLGMTGLSLEERRERCKVPGALKLNLKAKALG